MRGCVPGRVAGVAAAEIFLQQLGSTISDEGNVAARPAQHSRTVAEQLRRRLGMPLKSNIPSTFSYALFFFILPVYPVLPCFVLPAVVALLPCSDLPIFISCETVAIEMEQKPLDRWAARQAKRTQREWCALRENKKPVKK